MLEMRQLGLRFGDRLVFEHVNLELRAGQRMGLIGPSGIGKSSLLRLACGLQKPSSGVVVNGYRCTTLLFQEPRLLPWCTVKDNLKLPLQAQGKSAQEAEMLVQQWLESVALETQVASAWPHELSGGMAQRVALARALSMAADLLLMDEPFSALNPALRQQMTDLCDAILAKRQTALLCVSHHVDELRDMLDTCVEVTATGLKLSSSLV